MSIDDPSPEQLIERFFHEEMNSDDQSALAKLLRDSPAAREHFRSEMRTEGCLLALASQRQLEQRSTKDVNVRGEENAGALTGRRYWLAAVSLAAMLLLAFGLGRVSDNSANAAELFMHIERASQQIVDRVYRLERFVRRDGSLRRDSGTLSCRGAQTFVAEFPQAVIGGNSDGLWCVPKAGPAFTVPNIAAVANADARLELGWLLALQTDSRDAFSLSAAKIMALVRIHGYRIKRLPDAAGAAGADLNVLVCELDNPGELPRTVRIHSDQQSQEIIKLEIDWGSGERPGASDLLILELISTSALPDERFVMSSYQ